MELAAKIYLDYAASAPLRRAALEAEAAYRREPWAKANPNSTHSLGRAAARSLDGARRQIASALGHGFRPGDVAFTGGGTEANNIAVLGMAEGMRLRNRRRSRAILSSIEHDSVLDLASPLRQRGFTVSWVQPNREGVVEPEALEGLLGDDVALVAVMAANNETGAAQPIRRLGESAHRCGAPFFTDAIQAFCHVRLDLSAVDAVSLAAHKIGAAPGVGALAMRNATPFAPQSFGGGQEGGRRAGTQDVAGAVAFGKTAAELRSGLDAAMAKTSRKAERLAERLLEHPRVRATSPLPYDGSSRLPGIVNVCVDGLESETMILALDEAGFEVSAGSACSSGSLDPSHVLTAMGIPKDLAFGALRISFDERVSDAELEAFAACLEQILAARLGS